MAGLPNLAGPSGLGNVQPVALQDPMYVSDLDNLANLKKKWKDAVTDAATLNNEPLAANWSNLFECTNATNALFDLSVIFDGTTNASDIEATIKAVYAMLLSSPAQDWTLNKAPEETSTYSPSAYLARPFAEVFTFLGESFAFAPHCVAQVFEDNHLGLLRNVFAVRDGPASFAVGRLSLLNAISGGSKSPLLKMTEKILQSNRVSQACSDAPGEWCRALKYYNFYSTQGSNYEGLLAHAQKENAPIGIMTKHEELADTMSKIGCPTKDKLMPRQTITLSNPALTPGKRLGDVARNSSIENMKIVLTATVQGNLCFQFLPYTPEGESYRWMVCISPEALGLQTSRETKLCPKECTEEFLSAMLATQVLRILGSPNSCKGVDLDQSSRAVTAILEKAAKDSLQAWVDRVGHEAAAEDPMYAYLRGKVDAAYMSHYATVWALSESLLCWLNDLRVPNFRGNQVYARMALHRCLISDIDRRCLMVVNRRAINASPYLKAIVLGLSAEEVREKDQEAKRRKVGIHEAALKVPQGSNQVKVYIWQHVERAATMDAALGALVWKPHTYKPLIAADPVIKKALPRGSSLRDFISDLSKDHSLITHYGVPKVDDPDDIEWTALPAAEAVPGIRKRGQRGGNESCPALRFVPRDSATHKTFLEAVEPIFKLV
jgi:hypothetical protein